MFFEALRDAAARLPAGLIRLGPPTSRPEIAAAERALGAGLPHAHAELLGSFNGVDLFGGSVVLLGVGDSPFGSLAQANRPPPEGLRPGEIVIAQSSEGDLVILEAEPAPDAVEPRVFQLRPDADERWLAGSSLGAWLEATIAREEVLYDREGEFKLEAFEPDGDVTPAYALKQAERAARKDPGSALAQHELGRALRRIGRPEKARVAFERACRLDPENPWPSFELGRIQHELAEHGPAAQAFQQAARAAPGPAGARFLAWAVRCLVEQKDRAAAATADGLVTEALRRHPTLAEDLRRAADLEAEDGGDSDNDGDSDAEELARLLSGGAPFHRRLPVLPTPAKPPPRR
jgi:hypothetical protein